MLWASTSNAAMTMKSALASIASTVACKIIQSGTSTPSFQSRA